MMDGKRKLQLIQICYVAGGSLLFALSVNLIIIPLGLYNNGFMGVAQLVNIFFENFFAVPSGVDLVGIIYFVLNIPLFYLGYRMLGKAFAVKTLITVAVQSALLLIVPVPRAPVIEDYLTACIVGGLIAGTGVGLVLRGRSSGGGQDIIALCCIKKFPNFSVGKISILINIFVYGICLFLFNIEIVIYSLIYVAALSLAVDRVHIQNINTSVMIFTKETGVSQAIIEQTGRGVTNWDGAGAYTNEASHILLVVVSKYEVGQIKQIVHGIDPHAFMIFTEGCYVDGNFEKRL